MKRKFFKAFSLFLAVTMLVISTGAISGAAADDSLKADPKGVELTTSEATSVTVGITSATALTCYGIEGNWDIKEQGDTSYFKLIGIGSDVITFNPDEYNFVDVATGKVLWVDDMDGKFDGVTISDTTTNLLTATYEVAAGTPEGEYTVRFVTEVFTDSKDGPDETETVFEVKITVSHNNMKEHTGTAATCETDGWLTYYECLVCGKLCTVDDCDSNKEITNLDSWKNNAGKDPAKNHDWSVSYNWEQGEDGAWTCTATRTCANSEACTETATATVTSEQTKNPTCVAKGETTYTATFTETWAKTQTKTAEDVAVDENAHTWNTTPASYKDNGDGTHTASYACTVEGCNGTKSDEAVEHDFANGDCVCGAEKPAAGLKGDVDLDGDVDAEDVTLLARHVAKIEYITDATALINGDVNEDDIVDANDVTKLARYVAKIITDWSQE